jgi:hypothetical protein
MKKFAFFVNLGIVLFLFACVSQAGSSDPTVDKVSQAAELLGVSEPDLQNWVDSRSISVPTGTPEFSAEQLFQEYEESQLRVERAYKGKQIKVTGTVYSVQEAYDYSHTRYAIFFVHETGYKEIHVFFDESDIESLLNIRKAQNVTILGILIGINSNYVSDWIFIDHAKILGVGL